MRRWIAGAWALAAVVVVACGAPRPSATSPTAKVSADGGVAALRAALLDGGAEAGAPVFGACPEDAPWTGTVCLGAGYVACPGGWSMDDRSRCVHEGPLPEAGFAPSPDEEEDAGGEDENTTDRSE